MSAVNTEGTSPHNLPMSDSVNISLDRDDPHFTLDILRLLSSPCQSPALVAALTSDHGNHNRHRIKALIRIAVASSVVAMHVSLPCFLVLIGLP